MSGITFTYVGEAARLVLEKLLTRGATLDQICQCGHIESIHDPVCQQKTMPDPCHCTRFAPVR